MASHAIAPQSAAYETKVIGERLKLIYEALDPEVQQMFLDVACFFHGAEKSLVVATWDGSGWNGEDGSQTLLDKSLVALNKEGYIHMPYNLRRLGRGIAEDVLPSRIWKKEQISSIQGGRTQIRGILVGCWMHYDYRKGYCFFDSDVGLRHLTEKIMKTEPMPTLQLLAVEGDELREEFEPLSRDLVWLSWKGFKGTKLPSWLSLKNLRVMELYHCENLQELWQNNVELPLQLKELIIINTNIFNRYSFRCLPTSIGRLTHLKTLVLNGGGVEMRSLPEEFCRLESLEYLELSNIPELSTLPDEFGKLRNLRTTVGEPWGCNLKSLKYLSLSNTGVWRISISDDCCPRLETLKLSLNKYLREVETLPGNVREIIVFGCENLKNMRGIGGVLKLQRLEMRDCPDLEVLPCPAYLYFVTNGISINGCPKVERRKRKRKLDNKVDMDIHDYLTEDFAGDFPPCRISIQGGGRALIRGKCPNDSGQITKLKTFMIGSHNLTSLGELSWLTSLEIQDCKMFEFLPESFGSLFNVQSLKIEDSPLLELGSPWGCNLKSLKYLFLSNTGVKKISISNYCCPSLQKIDLSSNIHLTEMETLPRNVSQIMVIKCEKLKNVRGIGHLRNLLSLKVFDCPDLEVLPCPPYMDSPIQQITIEGCTLQGNIDITILRGSPYPTFSQTKCQISIQGGGRAVIRQEFLKYSCPRTKLITLSHNLTSLVINNCKMLESLPDSFGSLFNLQCLKIDDSPLLELGLMMGSPSGRNLRSLESLSLLHTGVKKISISDYCCPSLQTINLSSNIHLTAVDRLPKNLRGISVEGCEKMWTMMGICSLRHLENLVIIDCPKLKLLPIPKYIFSDGRRISIRGCPKADIDIFDDHGVRETVTSHDERFI